ncbi:MAG: cytochrome c [Nitrospira sp.]|nr:cytochrome c [Nitrospira sp.]MCP9441807.1 cytochrome c [Nitrospira sp.]
MGKAMVKIVVGLAVAAGLWFGSMAMGFPPVFQGMFVGFAAVGTLMFLLLDAPRTSGPSGWPAAMSVAAFYLILCLGYGAAASLWPQFDPEDEREKIAKLLDGKENPLDPWNTADVTKRIQELDEKAKMLAERIQALGGDQAPVVAQKTVASTATPVGTSVNSDDAMKMGEEQWQLQECYNCHKLRGEGGKKRGPELDNIGSYLTVEEIKQKILDPKSFMAEGFEKEWEKGRMPDKFKDVMSDGEVTALAAWLSTFKNTSVATPKPIKMK